MDLIEAFRASPAFLAFAVALLGLCVGSFLNVVAYRLPRRLEQDFQREAHQSWPCVPDVPRDALVSLSRPPSTCGSCHARIKPWHNVPVLGWLALRGRCASCGAAISVQYPLVEASTGLLSVVCALHFGFTVQLAGALLVTWILVALTVTDLRTMFLPDELTYLLLWSGLFAAIPQVFTDGRSAAIGAAAGFTSLWAVARLFEKVKGLDKGDAMGEGDFKLMAGLGAWLGWQSLPQLVFLSAAVGAVVGLGLILFAGKARDLQLPFGPYIAGAGWIAMIWGSQINQAYLSTTGIS